MGNQPAKTESHSKVIFHSLTTKQELRNVDGTFMSSVELSKDAVQTKLVVISTHTLHQDLLTLTPVETVKSVKLVTWNAMEVTAPSASLIKLPNSTEWPISSVDQSSFTKIPKMKLSVADLVVDWPVPQSSGPVKVLTESKSSQNSFTALKKQGL